MRHHAFFSLVFLAALEAAVQGPAGAQRSAEPSQTSNAAAIVKLAPLVQRDGTLREPVWTLTVPANLPLATRAMRRPSSWPATCSSSRMPPEPGPAFPCKLSMRRSIGVAGWDPYAFVAAGAPVVACPPSGGEPGGRLVALGLPHQR